MPEGGRIRAGASWDADDFDLGGGRGGGENGCISDALRW